MRVKLLMATGITVFVTAMIVALVQNTLSVSTATSTQTPRPTAVAMSPTVAPQATPRPVVDAEAVQQREATFQARLAAANEAIAASAAELAAAKQAQAELADKYNTLAQQQQRNAQALLVVTATAVPPAPAVTATPAYASMDALLAAIQAANPAAVLIQAPDTVMYANTVAYEFVFDMGTLYVTATDGSILYDGIAANARAVANARDQQRPPRDHGGRHHRDRDRDNDDDSEDGDDN